jgi:formyltetrahydrofolate-dependent phosphoribosylglycinamide formyltransferase
VDTLAGGANYTKRGIRVNARSAGRRRKASRHNEIRARALDSRRTPRDNLSFDLGQNDLMPPVRPIPAPLERPIRLAVLISGGGSTLANFLDKMAAGQLQAEIPLVVASRAECGGVALAGRAGLRSEIVERKAFSSVAEFSRAVFALCREARVDLVTLAGFLALVEVPDDFLYRVMNIHPALIPAFCGRGFYGHKVHEAVLERGAKVTGCTVHFADNHYDHGPIILQPCVGVRDDDTPDTLAARVFAAECEAYPQAIRLYAQGKLEIHDRRVRIDSPSGG